MERIFTEEGNGSMRSDSGVGIIECLAVARGTQHAAKHVSNDALMFDLVCNGLRECGWNVELIPESDLAETLRRNESADCVVSMAQRPENIELLRELEERGTLVINTPGAVTNCYRTNLVEVLRDSEVPFGRSLTLRTDDTGYARILEEIGSPFWLKRGDIHAAHANDVSLIENGEAYGRAMDDFRSRGILSLIAQEHLQGDVVKFYAVRGTGFFHAQYFETEEEVSFDSAPIQAVADRAAARAGLTIYGGDVVLTRDAGPVLIDLNSWPSFGRVRDKGAPKMVEAIRVLAGRRSQAGRRE